MAHHEDNKYPRIDASADLYINVVEEDIECAIPRDHCNCAVAQAIKRSVGREDAEAVIFPTVAYVLMPADRATIRASKASRSIQPGDLVWHRFRIGEALSTQILSFDETGEAQPGGFRFRPPSPSQRLTAKREASRNRQAPHRAISQRRAWQRDSYYRLDH
jgi:hypothetical protein